MSWTLTTVTILSSCLRTCSSSASSPWTTKVICDSFGSSVSPTARLSMLKPREASMPETCARTPGWFWTKAESTCRMNCVFLWTGQVGGVDLSNQPAMLQSPPAGGRGLARPRGYIMDDDKLAQLVVRYSADVRPGEVVSLLGPPAAEPLVAALYREILRAGGHPLVVMRPEACDEWLCREGSAEQLGFIDPLEEREAEVADVAVHVVLVPALAKDVDPARYALHQRARRPLLGAFLDRCAAGSIRWMAVAYPRAASTTCQDALVRSQFLCAS